MSSNTTDLSPHPTTRSGSKTAGSFKSGTLHPKFSGWLSPELEGHRFGLVEIVSREFQRVNGYRTLLMRCTQCGAEKLINYDNLKSGKTKGCQSCSQKCGAPQWLLRRMVAARQRCTNPKDKAFPRYGGRGIEFRFPTVKDAAVWVMENLGLEKGLELDRIDNEAGHYEPGNLRYANDKIQTANRRVSVTGSFHLFRKEHPEIRYADTTLRNLLSKGMTPDQIIERFYQKSDKPKGVYGTFSTADPDIVSLLTVS